MHVTLLWLVNERNELLIAQRAKSIDSDPGVWGPSVSGVVEEGESAAEAAVRELSEELGLTLPLDQLAYMGDYSFTGHPDGRVRDFSIHKAPVFTEAADSFVLQLSEVGEVKWIAIPQLRQFLLEHPEQVVSANAAELWNEMLSDLESVAGD